MIFSTIFCNTCRSVDCFRLGWPMRADADFFYQPPEVVRGDKNIVSCYEKGNLHFFPFACLCPLFTLLVYSGVCLICQLLTEWSNYGSLNT